MWIMRSLQDDKFVEVLCVRFFLGENNVMTKIRAIRVIRGKKPTHNSPSHNSQHTKSLSPPLTHSKPITHNSHIHNSPIPSVPQSPNHVLSILLIRVQKTHSKLTHSKLTTFQGNKFTLIGTQIERIKRIDFDCWCGLCGPYRMKDWVYKKSVQSV